MLVTTTDGRVCEVTSSGEEVSCVQVLSGGIGTLYGSPVLGADGTLYVEGWAEGLFAYGP